MLRVQADLRGCNSQQKLTCMPIAAVSATKNHTAHKRTPPRISALFKGYTLVG